MSKNQKKPQDSEEKVTKKDIKTEGAKEREELNQDLKHFLESLEVDSDKGHQIVEFVTQQIRVEQKSHSGPLPDIETLAGYDHFITNGADRIMAMAEKQQEHRIKIESSVVQSQNWQSVIGQIFGFVIALFAIGIGGYLTYAGYPKVGGLLMGGTVVSLVGIFVYGKKMQKKDED